MTKKILLCSSCVVFILITSVTLIQGSYLSKQNNVSTVSSGGMFAEFEGALLSVDIRDVALGEVLKQLSNQKNGITFLLPPSLEEEKVMMRFSDMKVDEGLDKILRPYNRIFIYKENHTLKTPPLPRLTEVRILSGNQKNKAKEPLMRIAKGSLQRSKDSGKATKGDGGTPRFKKEKKTPATMDALSEDIRVGNREEKLEAIKGLAETGGDVETIKALSFAINSKDPEVREKAVDALKKAGEDIVDEGAGETDTGDNTGGADGEDEGMGESSLTLGRVSGGSATVDLANNAPVRGVQFTVGGAKLSEVRTTARTEGFFAKVNQVNGRVILMSLSGKTIAPGNGPVAEVVCSDGIIARLSDTTVVQ